MSYNKILLIGNVGRDPEQRQAGQSTVVTFSLATNEKYNDSKGEQVEHTTWFNLSAWNKQGDTLMRYVKKGQQIYIEGRLRQREYTAQDGTQRTSLDVTVENFQLLGGRQDGDNENRSENRGNEGNRGGGSNGGSASNSGSSYQTERVPRNQPAQDNADDDLPF